MSSPLHLSGYRTSFLHFSVPGNFSWTTISRVSISAVYTRTNGFLRRKRVYNGPILFSTMGDGEAADVSEGHTSHAEHGCIKKKEGRQTAKASTPNELMERLKRYGVSGVLSYGLLNTAYYLTTFLVVWFYVSPAPGKMGYFAAVQRFLKVMALVWAGSQVTKVLRAGGALALAPLVDRGLSWFTLKFSFESRGKAFMAIAGFCFGLALLLFFVITLLWA